MDLVFRIVVVCVCCLLVARADAVQPNDRMEVHQLEANAEDWLSQQIRVTGRFASASSNRVRLVNSNIDFHLERASRRIHAGTKRLEMVGTLSRDGKQLICKVVSVRELPSEAKQFKNQRKRIVTGDHAELYALGQWARERGQWYNDRLLRRLAQKADHEAFDWEVDEAARREDVEQLLALAERAGQIERPQADVLRIRHRAMWVARRRLPEKDVRAVEELAVRAGQLLPDTQTEMTVEQLADFDEYFESPMATYAAASDEQLTLFHRALWVDLMAQAMELSAAAGADPGELATRVRRLLPERPELWRRFRLAELNRQAEEPGTLTRGKLLAVRDGYRELELPMEAETVVSRWLAAARTALVGDDAEGHLQLAADFRSLAAEDTTAAELYQQALAIDANLLEAREGLRELEYDYINGRWQRIDEIDAGAMRDERKQRRGELSVGDSEAEVLRRLPSPDRVTRTLSGTSIVEQWIYDGPPAFYIYLRRDLTSPTARVIATHRAPSPP